MRKSNRLVCGVGIKGNESTVDLNGNHLQSYYSWSNMIKRCYSPYIHKKHTTYIGCSVCDEWKCYSNYKQWFNTNYIDGYELDKDIIIDGNKIYSHETCCFIPHYLNCLFTDCKKTRGIYPTGVHLHNKINKFISLIEAYNKRIYLGSFDTPEEAHNMWLKTKREYARKLAIDAYMNNEIDERIMNAIIKKAYNLK